MSILNKIQIGENRFVEFKSDLPLKDQLAKTAVAYANGAGGEIFIGIDNKGAIKGLDDQKLNDYPDIITNIISDRCYPKIIPDVNRANIDNKAIILIRIYPGSNKPYYLASSGIEKGTYIRIGATNKLADKEVLRELERQRSNTSYDEEIDYRVPFEKFEFKKFKTDFKRLTGRNIKDPDFLNLKLIAEVQSKKYLTNAAVLLSGLTENTIIKCARFKGNDMSIFIDRKEFHGMLYDTVESVIKFIQTHIPLGGQIDGIQRKDKYELPMTAVREAVINAVVHRDYTIESDIKVAIFDDMVEIISPGVLPKSITLDEIKEGRSEIRNKVIARVFKEINFIEQWGGGIGKILRFCDQYGLKQPVLEEKGGFFSVQILRTKKDSSGLVADSSGLVADNSGLVADKHSLIIDYLMKNKKITTKDARSLLMLKDAMVRRILSKMTESGIILRKGDGRSTYYILNKK